VIANLPSCLPLPNKRLKLAAPSSVGLYAVHTDDVIQLLL
jgi:hypothetical protein